ncbi:MAG: BatD family protein [Polyangiaceae bacterium]|nr:BatD family protein [Polyangiaceae bacterium]
MSPAFLTTTLTLLCLLFTLPAEAATVEISRLPAKVGLNQTLVFEAKVIMEDGESEVSAADLKVKNATVQGPSFRTQQELRIVNFNTSRIRSTVVSWSIRPKELGNLKIGPAKFVVAGQTIQTQSVSIEVVNATQTAQRRRPRSIFDIFDMGQRLVPQAFPEAGPELQLEKAPNPIAFLRAIPSKRELIVGESVLVSVYAYGSRGPFQNLTGLSDPEVDDMLTWSVVDGAAQETPRTTTIDDQEFLILKMREFLFVPLSTGEKIIGSLDTVIRGNGRSYPAQGSSFGMKLISPPLELTVGPAPEGPSRPDNFVEGTVGHFTLKSEVSPRSLEVGDFAEVRISIQGRGRLPSQLPLPEVPGIEWNPPTIRKDHSEVIQGELRGEKSLTYLIEAKETGRIELGNLQLSYFDPKKGKYSQARTSLGSLLVTAATQDDRLGALPHSSSSPAKTAESSSLPRVDEKGTGLSKLEPQHKAATLRRPPLWPFKSSFWILVLSFPGVAGLTLFARRLFHLGAHYRNRAQEKKRPQTQKQLALALDAGDMKLSLKYLDRLLNEKLETLVKAPVGGLGSETLRRTLENAGFPPHDVQQWLEFKDKINANRFGTAQDDPSLLLKELNRLATRKVAR